MSKQTCALTARAAGVLAGAVLLGPALSAPASAATQRAPRRLTPVVVVAQPDAARAAEHATRALGGRVERDLQLIHGFTARVPGLALVALRHERSVRSVVRDRAYKLSSTTSAAAPDGAGGPGSSLDTARAAIGAGQAVDAGDGSGVDVAIVDSGVSPVPGLNAPGKVAATVDFSADASDSAQRGLDGFGHGTHLAGIIAGDDPADGFDGIAPGARIVDVKVADHDGSTSLAQLLAGIDWIVRNHDRGGLDIRVMNLAFGASPAGSYRDDPLAFAVEQAWRHGIVVVTAAGNGGAATDGLDSPAYDPYVLAVGAEDTAGTATPADDTVAPFSSAGDGVRNPDVVVPGVDIVSLRVPGGLLDQTFPAARIGDEWFRGSGTSQAAAVASGAVALLLAQRPQLDPDAAKSLLVGGARPLAGAPATVQGAGLVDVGWSLAARAPRNAQQHWLPARLGGAWRAHAALAAEFAPDAGPRYARWSYARWSYARWSYARWSSAGWQTLTP